jgi:hypothetical protein
VLIILSGAETIHKKFFARQIIAALNTFEVDGYTVTFKDHVPTVKDSSGTIVYKPAEGEDPGINHLLIDLDNDGVYDEAGNATFNKIMELNDRVFLAGVRDSHFAAIYVNTLYDFRVTSELVFEDYTNDYIHPTSFESIMERYNTREFENYVISGSFSKGFIDKVRDTIGAENVTAINITRNPSVCALIHEKPDAYYTKNSTYTRGFNQMKLSLSLTNNASLLRFDDIITYRFEDILRTGKFTVLGVEVDIPAGYTPYNEWLTVWEREEHVSLGLCSSDELDAFNEKFQHLTSSTPDGDQDPRLPENIFELTNYDPLDHDDILDNGQPD